MTLIGATKVNDKWTLLVDSAVTIGQVMADVTQSYRPKLREIEGANVKLIAAGCGTIKDVDFVLNILENKLAKKKFKTKNELKFFLQETLADAHRELKTLSDDPQAAFLILETKTDTLWIADEYSITEPKFCAQIAFGSADQQFYKAKKEQDFFTAFSHAVECDTYCSFPLISYRDGETEVWYQRNNPDSFYSLGGKDEPKEELCCNGPIPIHSDPERARVNICDGTDKAL